MFTTMDGVNIGFGVHWSPQPAITGRPLMPFEYSAEAISKGLELSSYLLPLKGDSSERTFLHIKWDC